MDMPSDKTRVGLLSANDLTAVFSVMAEGLLVVNKERIVIALNQIGGIFLRTAPVEAVGSSLKDIFKLYKIHHNEKIPWPIDPVTTRLDFTRVTIWDRVYCENKAGMLFPITMMVTPLLKQGVQGAVILFRDASDEMRLDQAKSDFLSIASHQLHTPLTAIKLFAEMLESEEGDANRQQRKEHLELLRTSVERMIRLINDMLNVSRLEAGVFSIRPEPTDVVAFIRQALRQLQPIADKQGCTVELRESSASVGALPMDTRLFEQVIFNLVENAIRYSKSGTCYVTISITEDAKQKRFIISVADNGIGIPAADRKHIFTKFFRADNARKAQSDGNGLGLYVVKTIVEAWGGDIWFDSPIHAGTTFYVTIPADGMKEKKGTKDLLGTS